MWSQFKDVPVERSSLYALTRSSELNEKQLHEAFETADIYPDKKSWLVWIDRFLLSLGVVFLLCGISFFVAFNWDDLGKFSKLAMAELGVLIAGVFIILKSDRSFAQQMALTAFCVLTGILFALFGQTYQTGANAYDLFLNWSLTIIPFVVFSRYTPLWFFWLVLINATIYFYFEQVVLDWNGDHLLLIMLGLQGSVWIGWEMLSKRFNMLQDNRWAPAIAGLFCLFALTVENIYSIVNSSRPDEFVLIFGTLYAVLLAVGIWFYTRQRSMFFLSALFLSIVGVVTVQIFDWLNGGDRIHFEGPALLSGIACLGLTTGFIWRLVQLNKKWNTKPITENAPES